MFLSRPPRSIERNAKKKPAPLKIDLKSVQEVKSQPQSNNSNSNNNSNNNQQPAIPIESFRGVFSQCSERIYLGDGVAAKNKEQLIQLGITHILNCTVSIENFYPELFTYKKIELNDSLDVDIISLFYEVIDFIETAVSFSGKVFIHCNYGVSRSGIMAICYFVYLNNWNYDTALKYLKQCRPIIEPNTGFVFSLLSWDNLRKTAISNYRIYSIVPFSETSTKLVATYLQNSSSVLFDNSSACYIVQTNRILYIWMGSNCDLDKIDTAVKFTEFLQHYEKAVGTTQLISQSLEPDHFRALFPTVF